MNFLYLKKQQLLDFVIKYKLFVIFVSVKFRLPEKANVKVFIHSLLGIEIARRLRSTNIFAPSFCFIFQKVKWKQLDNHNKK